MRWLCFLLLRHPAATAAKGSSPKPLRFDLTALEATRDSFVFRLRGEDRGWAVWQYAIRSREITQELVYTVTSEFRPLEEERLRVVLNRLSGEPISTFHHIDLFSPKSDTVMMEHDLEVRRGAISGRRSVRTKSGETKITPVDHGFPPGTVLADYVFLAGAGATGAGLPPGLWGQAGPIKYEAFSLPNGLRVIYAIDHAAPIVTVDLWYATGARNERPGHSGFAHLFEHLMFQGSAHVKKSEHFQLIERAGGTLNGSTHDDYTNYYETVPSNRLNLALWLEADRMRSLAVTQPNLDNQRETVKEEKRLRADNQPYAPTFGDGITWPFDSTGCFAYAHTAIGSMADLDAARLADVQAFFDTYYAPNNATLVVVGDVQRARLRQLVNAYFAEIPSHAAPPPVRCTWKLAPGTVHRTVEDAHATLPAVMRFYRLAPPDPARPPAPQPLDAIPARGESS